MSMLVSFAAEVTSFNNADFTNLSIKDFTSLNKSLLRNGTIGLSVWYNTRNGSICLATDKRKCSQFPNYCHWHSHSALYWYLLTWLIKCKKSNKCWNKHQYNEHLNFPGQQSQIPWLFQTFPHLRSFSMIFQTWKISALNSMTFQTFPGSVQTLKRLQQVSKVNYSRI